MAVTIRDGVQDTYHVTYVEDNFLRYSQEQQDDCFAAWMKKATQQGCTRVVLTLLPDIVFPSGTHTTPYVFRQELCKANLPEFAVQTTTIAVIREEIWAQVENDIHKRTELLQKVRAAALRQTPLHGTYVIRADGRVTEIERERRG